jgi:hypothetical protein
LLVVAFTAGVIPSFQVARASARTAVDVRRIARGVNQTDDDDAV